jgi:hypothetical protein
VRGGYRRADRREFVLTNRSTEDVDVDVTVLDANDTNWSVHTLRRANLVPRDSFSVQVHFCRSRRETTTSGFR